MHRITSELNKFSQNSSKLLELQLRKYFNNLTYNEVRAIECIDKNKKLNLTSLADEVNISRGGATKLTKRLVALGFIEKYTNENNRKEVYFKLTTNGRQINDNHMILHENWDRLENKMFNDMSDEIQGIVFEFLIKANKLSMDEIDKIKADS